MPELPINVNKEKELNYFRFEQVQHEYVGKDGKKKKTTRCERVQHSVKVTVLRSLLLDQRKKYLYHRYQIHQDKYIWPKVLASFSPIFHLDYSENLQFTIKYEPQTAHFNKRQITLHCTVIHALEEGEAVHKFIYHLSDTNTHDAGFTSTVIDDLLSFYPESDVYRIKSDNCSCQYKCKYIFQRYKLLASSTKKTFVVYYGVSGHGKGLVDAMSGFGVKNPIRKVIILENEFFYTSKDIVEYLEKKMKQPNRFYIPVDEEKLRNEQKDKGEFKIHGCTSLHMLSFLTNGIICGKQNLCSCDECNVGKFYHCKIVP